MRRSWSDWLDTKHAAWTLAGMAISLWFLVGLGAYVVAVVGGWLSGDTFRISTQGAGQFGDAFGAVNALFSALAFALLVLTNYKSQMELERTQRHLDETLKTNADIASTQKKSTAIQVLEMMAEAKAQEIAVHRQFANYQLPLKADPLHMPYEHRHNFAMAKAQQLDAIATTSALIFAGNADPIRSIQEMQLRHLLADAVLTRVVYHDRPIDQVIPVGLRMWLIRTQTLAKKLGVSLVTPPGQPPMTDDPPNIISDLNVGCVTIVASVRAHLRDRFGVELSGDDVS